SSCVDRFTSADNDELNVELLIKNLKIIIMKKLSILCITRSSASLSAFSATASFSA
ncbi:hypothetical protein BDBG_16134, partial [Blastomyces gilchristii SLH14081]